MATQKARSDPFGALSSRTRRRILMSLLNKEEVNPQNVAESRLDLIHNHLPRLEDLGYIQWNDTGSVEKGENWSEVAPLLDLIEKNQGELPEDCI